MKKKEIQKVDDLHEVEELTVSEIEEIAGGVEGEQNGDTDAEVTVSTTVKF